MNIPEELVALLARHEQSQVTQFWPELSLVEQQALLRQIQSIDFRELPDLISQARQSRVLDTQEPPESIQPLDQVIRLPQTEQERLLWAEAHTHGQRLLDAGRVGAILVAGGQGSRLGFPHPKGMYPIGPVTDRTLFQIFFEQLLALSNRHGVRIPYFIMTSEATHADTEVFLRQHAWFGYPPEDVILFQQGTMPAVDAISGKILLSAPGEIAMSPDGHGGLLNALHRAGLIEEMQNRRIDYLYYHQVDNPCAILCDPTMIGFHDLRAAEISTKVVAKRDASEKVGVLARRNGKQAIIEYSDLPPTLAEQLDDHQQLAYWAGNIAVHVFSRQLLERLTSAETGLPIHIAHKKVPFIDETGRLQEPDKPNAWKFEQFIFDAIPRAHSALVIETERTREFNPVKNAEGLDSPAAVREALLNLGRQWLREAGYSPSETLRVEISPLLALAPEDLQGQLDLLQLPEDELLLVPSPED